MTTSFTKPARTLPELYAKITGRGLAVASPADLRYALENLGYYRLGGYAYPFLSLPIARSSNPARHGNRSPAFMSLIASCACW